MSDKIDLKDIERRAYISYHEDGIIDLIIGFSVIIASLYMFADMFWLAGSFVAVSVPIYMSMKKKITFPRLGQVTFSKNRTGKAKNSFWFLIGVNVIALMAGFFFWWSFSGGSPPSWFPMFLEYFSVIIGALVAVVAVAIAFISEIERFKWYAVVSFVALGSSYFIGTPIIYHLALLGAIITVAGYLQLQRFKEKYPLVGEA